jgi:hypothetical protein
VVLVSSGTCRELHYTLSKLMYLLLSSHTYVFIQGIGDVPDLKWKHEFKIMCGWWALALLIFLPGTIINAVDECNSIKGLCIGEHTSAAAKLHMQTVHGTNCLSVCWCAHMSY